MTEAPSPTGVDEAVDAISNPADAPRRMVTVVAEDVRTSSDSQIDPTIDLVRWSTLAGAAAESLGAGGELTLTFVDAEEIAALNRDHMGVDGPTDVLSFPLDDDEHDGDGSVFDVERRSDGGPPRLIGDIVICPAVAATAASSHAGTIEDELALLVVHGVLHLLGYDHANPDDTASMQAQEMTILTTYHWRGPAPANFRHDHAEPAVRPDQSAGGS